MDVLELIRCSSPVVARQNDQITCSRNRLYDLPQYIYGSCGAHQAKALSQGDWKRHPLRFPGCQRPDQAWRPQRLPSNRSRDWPSVVMEIAYSEIESKLRSDVRFWMRASGGDVKVVLTLRINRQQPKIRIEKWVGSNNNNKNNNNNNRHHLDQSVNISKAESNCIILSNAPLTIGFEDLFLRPASIPREEHRGGRGKATVFGNGDMGWAGILRREQINKYLPSWSGSLGNSGVN